MGKDVNIITGRVVDLAVRMHSALGPGLLESVYETILVRGLCRSGLEVVRQKSVSFEYDGMRFENAFRPDIVIEQTVIVEVKSVPYNPLHERQLLLTSASSTAAPACY
ncbi:MAG TPA: GxxExxY protein [Longimicrobiales bacterium]|nr:GxxExxY protein [Longimicrobiales bacterium]